MLKAELATTRLQLLKSAHIASYRDQRLSKVSQGSVRREMAILQHCIGVAHREWQLIATNPTMGVTKPIDNPSRSRRPSEAELNNIAEALLAIRNPVSRQVFQFALATGMRRGEVLSLEWQHLDWNSKTAFLPMTKNGDSRTIPLSPQALDVLKQRLNQLSNYCSTPRPDRVFPITANALRLTWERMRIRTKIKDLRFHDLRHEAISRFFELGLSVPEVALISGHKDTRMLFRYTHLRAEDIAQKIAAIPIKQE
jgi:integrase